VKNVTTVIPGHSHGLLPSCYNSARPAPYTCAFDLCIQLGPYEIPWDRCTSHSGAAQQQRRWMRWMRWMRRCFYANDRTQAEFPHILTVFRMARSVVSQMWG
jgi:hypothetical protein